MSNHYKFYFLLFILPFSTHIFSQDCLISTNSTQPLSSGTHVFEINYINNNNNDTHTWTISNITGSVNIASNSSQSSSTPEDFDIDISSGCGEFTLTYERTRNSNGNTLEICVEYIQVYASSPPSVTFSSLLDVNDDPFTDTICAGVTGLIELKGGFPEEQAGSGDIGRYSGIGVTNTNTGFELDQSQLQGGQQDITYTYTEPGGCSATATYTIDVVGPTFSVDPKNVCKDVSAPVTLSGGSIHNGSYGVYSGPGVSENNGVYTFDPTAAGVVLGKNKIDYTQDLGTGCGPQTVSDYITVYDYPGCAFCDDCSGTTGDCEIPTIETNNDLAGQCEELNIMLILDESGSINSSQSEQVREATLTFMEALLCTQARLSIIEFNAEGRYVEEEYRLITKQYVSDIRNYFAFDYNGKDFNPSGGTNWQAALQLADDKPVKPDLLLFFTDGIPSIYTQGNGYTTDCGSDRTHQPEFVNPMKLANKLKQEGAHIFGLGVGDDADLELRLSQLTGNIEFDPAINEVSNSDYYITDNFSAFAASMSNFARQLCPPPFECSNLNINRDEIELVVDNSTLKNGSQITIRWSNGTSTGTEIITESGSGGPQTITITNGAPFPNAEYTVSITSEVLTAESAQVCSREDICVFNLILPIKLTEFTAEEANCQAKLNWSTSTEINNSHFNVERSDDGIIFETIAKVDGHGNSHEDIEYSYIDTDPKANKQYYRLTQVDFNGDQETFNVQQVRFDDCNLESSLLSVTPNPLNETSSINIDDKFLHNNSVIHILSVEGKIVESLYAQNEVNSYNFMKLPKGIYFVYAVTEDGIKSNVVKLVR